MSQDLVAGAMARGYTLDEIADIMGKQHGLDVQEIRARGYSSDEIIKTFGYSVPTPPQPGLLARAGNFLSESYATTQASPMEEQLSGVASPAAPADDGPSWLERQRQALQQSSTDWVASEQDQLDTFNNSTANAAVAARRADLERGSMYAMEQGRGPITRFAFAQTGENPFDTSRPLGDITAASHAALAAGHGPINRGEARTRGISDEQSPAPKYTPFDGYISHERAAEIIAANPRVALRDQEWDATLPRGAGLALQDAAGEIGIGVRQIAGTPVSLFAPDSERAKENAAWRRDAMATLSPQVRANLAQADQRIREAAKEGLWEEVKMVGSEYFTNPMLAQHFATTTLPSMIGVLAPAKLAQMLVLIRGGSAAAAQIAATIAASSANAVMTGGDARQGAYDDLLHTYMKAGMSREEAAARAKTESLLPAVVGMGFGALSGAIGAESVFFRRQTASTALGRAFSVAAREIGTELPEELMPLIATNAIATETDGRSLLKEVPATAGQTIIGVAPMAGIGAVQAARMQPTPEEQQFDAQALRDKYFGPRGGAGPGAAPPASGTPGAAPVQNVDDVLPPFPPLPTAEQWAAEDRRRAQEEQRRAPPPINTERDQNGVTKVITPEQVQAAAAPPSNIDVDQDALLDQANRATGGMVDPATPDHVPFTPELARMPGLAPGQNEVRGTMEAEAGPREDAASMLARMRRWKPSRQETPNANATQVDEQSDTGASADVSRSAGNAPLGDGVGRGTGADAGTPVAGVRAPAPMGSTQPDAITQLGEISDGTKTVEAQQAEQRAQEEAGAEVLGDGDYLSQLFGNQGEQSAPAPSTPPKTDLAPMAASLRQLAEQKLAEANDWASRDYKQNNKQVELQGDGPRRNASISVSGANESRRARNVESLKQQAQSASNLANRIENGRDVSAEIETAIRNADSDIARDGKPPGKMTRDDMIESYIARSLLGDDFGGYGAGTPSNAIRLAYEAAQTPTPTPAPAGVSASTAPQLRTNGQPFASEKSAATSAKSRGLDLVPVPVEGGWGLAARDQAPVTAERQAAIDATEQAETRAEREAADKERATRERDDVRRRSEAAADTFELGQSAEDNLSGQGPLFSRGAGGLDTIKSAIRDMGVDITASERDGIITVPKIVVPESARNQGVGTQAMQALVDYADDNGLHIALTPSSDFGGNKTRLTEFYKRFGFRENKGRDRVQSVSESMIRENPNGGIVYSFAGPNAATADTMALDTAKSRIESGENAETVRRETGWFKGNDGKWRFEINDSDAKAHYPGNFKESVMAAWRNLSELSGDQSSKVMLDDVLRHPALFAAYPQLRNIEIQFLDSRVSAQGRLERGAIDGVPFAPVLKIREDLSADAWLNVLLHEIQHGIQNIEGFATGGSANAMTTEVTSRREIVDAYGAFAEQLQIAGVDTRNMPDLDALLIDPDQTIEDYVFDVPRNAENSSEVEWAADALTRAINAGSVSPFQQYRRLAGEVEARNTQTRQRMTDAERQATPPSATADVADADVIVVFNGTEMASAPAPANSRGPRQTTPTPVTTLTAAFKQAFPNQANTLDRMIQRGEDGRRGGVVFAEDEAALAQAFADKTGRTLEEAMAVLQMSVSPDGMRQVMRAEEVNADPQRSHEFRLAVEQIAKERYAGKAPVPVTVNTTNEVVFVSWSSARHVLRDGTPDWKTALAVLHMEPLMRAAEKVSWTPDYKGRSDPSGAYLYKSDALIDGVEHTVEITVRQHSDGKRYYDHIVVQEKPPVGLLESGSRGDNASANQPTPPFAGGDQSIGQKAPNIKRARNGTINGFYDPQSGLVFINQSAVTADTIGGVMLHEAMHGGQNSDVDAKAMKMVADRDKASTPATLRPLLAEVAAKMEAAGVANDAREASAYIVEAAANYGRQNGFSVLDGKFMTWLDGKQPRLAKFLRDWIAGIRAWGMKHGLNLNPTVDDLVAFAQQSMAAMARGEAVTGSGPVSGSAMRVSPPTKGKDEITQYLAANAVPLPPPAKSQSEFEAMFDRYPMVDTPIGEVKIGENQWAKLSDNDRVAFSGLVQPTLADPVYVVRDADGAEVFIKSFLNTQDKTRVFVSVTRGFDGVKVSFSNHLKDINKIVRLVEGGELLNTTRPVERTPNQVSTQQPTSGGIGPVRNSVATSRDDSNTPQFSRSGGTPGPGSLAQGGGRAAPRPATLPAETEKRAAQRVTQDDMNRFTVVQNFLQDQGMTLDVTNDVWKAEVRMHGIIAVKIEEFRERRIKPLIKRTQKAKIRTEEMTVWLVAEHAEERNAQIRKVDPTNDAGSGMTDQQARDILAGNKVMYNGTEYEFNAAQRTAATALADEYRAIAEDAKQMRLAAGLLDQDMVDAWEGAYTKYVPLKGGDTDGAQGGSGQRLSARVRNKRALGHDARDEMVVENLIRDYELAVHQTEKNRVAQTTLKLILDANNPEIGTVDRPAKRKVLRPGDSAWTVQTSTGLVVASFDNQQDARRYIVANKLTGAVPQKVWADPMVAYQASSMMAENEFMVYVKGNGIRVQLNDPMLAQAYNRIGVDGLGWAFGIGRSINAHLSKVYTGLNPEFLYSNVQRDLQFGVIKMTADYGIKAGISNIVKWPSSFAQVLRYRLGGNGSNDLRQYLASGGTTGVGLVSDIERIGKDIQLSYDQYRGAIETFRAERGAKGTMRAAQAATWKLVQALTNWIEHLNASGENAMRLATFRTVRDLTGGDVAEAAVAAKMITTNFNKRGEKGQHISALYLFYNPAVQSTAAYAESMLYGKHKYQAWALQAGVIVGIALMARMQWDDDEWEKLNESDKTRNLLIRTGVDSYIKVPIAYGPGFFPQAAQTMYDMDRGLIERDVAAIRLASAFIEHFGPAINPLQAKEDVRWQDAGYAIAPTVPQMAILAPAFNMNDFGGEMVPSSMYDEGKPDNQRMFRSTKGTAYADFAEWLNTQSGGTKSQKGSIDVSPETLKHWVTSLTGGAGAFVADTYSLGKNYLTGELDPDSTELRDLPFVRKTFGKMDIRDLRRPYYDLREKSERAKENYQRAIKMSEIDVAEKVWEDNKATIAMYKMLNAYGAQIKNLRDQMDVIMLNDELTLSQKRAQVREIEGREAMVYREIEKNVELFKDSFK